MVNVITGASKTGKSAVIPIIDYCLASRHCAIPVGVIREKCAWFGVLMETAEGQKLFARKEPGIQQSTNEMFVLEAVSVEVPEVVTEGNSTDSAVRALLDRLAGLTQLDFEPNTEFGFKLRPSFRDLTAFIFQPQNIVANPNVLFYKADANEHREKLKTVLPYVLNAITARTIALRHEADRLTRRLRKLEADLKVLKNVSGRRIAEGRTWLTQARELGLSTRDGIPEQWGEILIELELIANQSRSTSAVSAEGIENTLAVLNTLRDREQKLGAEASTHRQRLMELKRLREGSDEYAGALKVQRERLSLSTWMRAEIEGRHEAELLFTSKTAESLDKLDAALVEIEGKLQAHPLATTSLDAEYQRQRTLMENVLSEITIVRQEIRTYEAGSELVQKEMARTASADRFIGGLQQLLRQYDEADKSPEIETEVEELRKRIEELQAQIKESNIQRRLDSTLDEIQQITGTIVPALNAEWSESPIRLDPKELTVQVSRDGRKDYLWEIGSGANWLAYHVAITLALQIYFFKNPPSPVPALLVYDQPSQVYFPTMTKQPSGERDWRLTDQEDIQAVRRIFEALGKQVVSAKGALQVIVLDHADQEVWGDLPGVSLVEEWRGKKLVPIGW
ncbi:DUF3732 domain-containing protein [Xanthomonas campestris]|uniref:DUF3732 domain-containing protein n=1 Tax=Xanthomonas campestris TaxID=339 RepID=UPI001E42A724|nr:DUF3732 domain-containing protein [Xanthomonas campestris]MCC5070202.1 DUF3732 domain-containing protein [Xanthomonas campestris]